MAPHSSTFAWKVPWTEEPGGLQSMGSLRVGYDWATSFSLFTFHFHALEKEIATHSSVLAWRIPGMGEPGGLPSMGSHRVGHDWSDLAATAKHLALPLGLVRNKDGSMTVRLLVEAERAVRKLLKRPKDQRKGDLCCIEADKWLKEKRKNVTRGN